MIVSSIGVFILLNKNLRGHPYPMIAIAMIANGAFMASYSNLYWKLNAYLYFKYSDDWIETLFKWSCSYLLMIINYFSENLDLDNSGE
jgi:hypothetical protein